MDVAEPAGEAERRAALAMLVGQPETSRRSIDHQVDLLLGYARRRGLSLEHCLVARDGNRLAGSCLCVDAAGRTATVFLSAETPGGLTVRQRAILVQEAVQRAGRRNVRLIQGLAAPEAETDAQVYAEAGFEHLAELIYLEADPTQPLDGPTGADGPALAWVTYSPQTHALFATVASGTYERSLDCAGLNDRRDVEDVLASHRSAGQFDPRFWFVAVQEGEPVGMLLLSHVAERTAYEVVYMGVLPPWRGRRIGSMLLRKARRIARDQAAPRLTLAVDAVNTPARRLYAAFGFVETSRRNVWIRFLSDERLPESA